MSENESGLHSGGAPLQLYMDQGTASVACSVLSGCSFGISYITRTRRDEMV
jgi:hypothetical protein